MMKIKVTEREIKAVKNEEVGRGNLTEVQVCGINALAEEVFDELYYDFMGTDQSEVFDGYLGVVTYLADNEPAVAVEIVGCMMKERELEKQLDKTRAFIAEDEEHVKAFARHFAIAGIMRKIEEEELEEEIMEEMEDEPEEPEEDHCKGCMGACFGDCSSCRHQKAGVRNE